MSRRQVLLSLLFLLALVAVVHGRGLGGELLEFDDDRIVHRNPVFAAPTGEAIGRILTEPIADAWLPVAHLSLYLDWKVFGGRAWGLHLGNLVWHLLTLLALLALLGRLGVPWAGALAGVALFAVHPALVEAVAWVASRKVLLAGFFSLLALIGWVDHLRGGARRLLLVGVATALALLAYPGALVVLPWLVLLTLAVPRGEDRHLPWLGLGGVALLTGGALAVHLAVAAGAGTADGGARPPLLALGTLGHYLLHALVPTGLSVDYPFGPWLERLSGPGVVRLLLGVLPPLVGGLLLWRRPAGALRWAGLGLLLFWVGLLPYNNVLPASAVVLADRYLYLPLVGLALAVAALVGGLRLRMAGIGLCVVAGGLGAWSAWGRSADFRDTASLWEATLRAEPRSAVAHYNLATELLRRGGRSAATGERGKRVEALLTEARKLAVRPVPRARALGQHATVAAWQGDLGRAAELLRQARAALGAWPLAGALATKWAEYGLSQAKRLEEKGNIDEARALIADIRTRLPDYHPARLHLLANDLLQVEAAQRRGDAAGAARLARTLAPRLQAMVKDAPRSYEARMLQAKLEATRLAGGTFLRAMVLFNRARELAPDRKESYIEVANIFQSMEEPDDRAAELELNKGLKILPRDPDLLHRKGYLLYRMGRHDDGLAYLRRAWEADRSRTDLRTFYVHQLCHAAERMLEGNEKKDPRRYIDLALSLDRDAPEVRHVFGLCLVAAGRLGDGVKNLRRAHTSDPGERRYRVALADALKKWAFLLLPRQRGAALDLFRSVLDLAGDDVDVAGIEEIMDGAVRVLHTGYRAAFKGGDLEAAGRNLDRALALVHPERAPLCHAVLTFDRVDLLRRAAQPVAASRLLARVRPEGFKALTALGLPAGATAPAAEAWFKVQVFLLLERKQGRRAHWASRLLPRLYPDRPLWPYLQARVHDSRGERARARALLAEARKRYPADRTIRGEYGRLLCHHALVGYHAGKGDAALEDMVRGARLCPPHLVPEAADTLLRRTADQARRAGRVAWEAGRWPQARRAFARAVHFLPPGVKEEIRATLLYRHAICWIQEDKRAQALVELERLDKELRARPLAFHYAPKVRANLLLFMNKPGRAREVLEGWLKQFPQAEGAAEIRALLARIGSR